MSEQTSRDRLKVGETGAIQINTAQDAIDFATWCYESGYLPEHIANAKQAFTIAQRGAEMGLPPFAAWRFIYRTKGGKLALESKGALAVCQSKPSFEDYQERIEGTGDSMRAVAIASRKGRKPTIKEFTMEDAKRAGLLKRPTNRRGETYDGPWQSYLVDMLLSKARERALSIAFAAELGGIPVEGLAEEIEARQTQAQAKGVGLREKMQALRGEAPKELPEGQPVTTTITDLIQGQDFVAQEAQERRDPNEVEIEVPPLEKVISDQVDTMFRAKVESDMEAAQPQEPDPGPGEEPGPAPQPEAKRITTCQYNLTATTLCSKKVVDGTVLCSEHHFEEEKETATSPFAAALRGRGATKESGPGQSGLFGPDPEEE